MQCSDTFFDLVLNEEDGLKVFFAGFIFFISDVDHLIHVASIHFIGKFHESGTVEFQSPPIFVKFGNFSI